MQVGTRITPDVLRIYRSSPNKVKLKSTSMCSTLIKRNKKGKVVPVLNSLSTL
jgi:hypothetical protein